MSAALPRQVTIVEVGPRDGLQNEASVVPTAAKIAFVDALSRAGHRVIEVSAFVSPKWVPQMADAGEVFAGIERRDDVRYTALVPNLAGLARAEAAGGRAVANVAAGRVLKDVHRLFPNQVGVTRSIDDFFECRAASHGPDAVVLELEIEGGRILIVASGGCGTAAVDGVIRAGADGAICRLLRIN